MFTRDCQDGITIVATAADIDPAIVTAGVEEIRANPITGVRTTHTGADFAAPLGTAILAFADGRVVFAGDVTSGYGHLILIEHRLNGRPVYSGYAHMYAAGIHVRQGEYVTAGQHIADVGADGKSTGPHLHFEIRPGGASSTPVNPESYLAGTQTADLPSAAEAEPCR